MKLPTLIFSILMVMTLASAQAPVFDIPFERRTANSPTTVLAYPEMADIPQFIVDPFWPKPLPNNWLIGQVSGVHVDATDNIWIVQRPKSLAKRDIGAALDPPLSKCCFPAPPVLEFDQSGNLLRAWGGPGNGYDWPKSEHGIHIADGFVWLAGNALGDNQILKFTMNGKFVMQIGKPDQSAGSNDTENFGRPADFFVDVEAREVYVADGYGNRRIVVFDTETGTYKRHWGAYGNTPHDEPLPPYDPTATPSRQFGNPVHCIQLSTEGLVYVCDRTNNRVQIFQKNGTFVSETFFEPNTLMNGSVYDLAFSLDPAQRLMFMVDGMNNELRIIDRVSNITRGRIGRTGRSAGQFYSVHDITIDSQGNLYTTEVQTGQRVQKFRRLSQ
jgi:DNA-binding beta-propeller fold protein YncE